MIKVNKTVTDLFYNHDSFSCRYILGESNIVIRTRGKLKEDENRRAVFSVYLLIAFARAASNTSILNKS
jgi:hypothetical protein